MNSRLLVLSHTFRYPHQIPDLLLPQSYVCKEDSIMELQTKEDVKQFMRHKTKEKGTIWMPLHARATPVRFFLKRKKTNSSELLKNWGLFMNKILFPECKNAQNENYKKKRSHQKLAMLFLAIYMNLIWTDKRVGAKRGGHLRIWN